MLTAFAIGFVCFFFSKFFVKTKDLQSANSVFVDDNSKLNDVNSKSTMTVDTDGKEWFLNDERHRTDGPAIDLNSKSTMTVLYGCKIWKNNKGEFHRVDGPAVEYSDGKKEWCINDKLHRTDGPAVEYANGTKKWFVDGICHRTDGPAIELANGMRYWYVNGKLHREDGPAVEGAIGHKEWHLNGLLHRTDGPAVEYAGGVNKSWHIEGKELTETEFNDYVNSKSFMVVNGYGAKVWKNKEGKYHREDSPAVEGKDGSKQWFSNGKRHRTDGPAVEHANGTKEWFVNGKRHRTDGPAIEWHDGSKEWFVDGNVCLTEEQFNDYVNSKSTMAVDKYGHKFWKNKKGQYHREDGPACEYVHGIKQWFVEGKELTEQQFNDYSKSKSTMTVDTDGKKWTNKEGEYHRTDGPAIELLNGTKFWYLNGKFHRTDGPAIELLNGSKFWYLNGKLHRVDGPAVEWTGGTKSWYIEGRNLTEQQFNRLRPADSLTRNM